jgi:hypothetical protein
MRKPAVFLGVIVFAAALTAGLYYPIFFATITFVSSMIVLGQIELDRNAHEVHFYTQEDLTPSVKRWLKAYTVVEVVGRSTIFAILSFLLFSGTDSLRITLVAISFLVCVLLGYYFLRWLQFVSSINVARWGYVRLSILLGVLFSTISGSIPGIGISEIAWSTYKTIMLSPSIDGVAELLFGLTYKVNEIVLRILQSLLGSFLGSIVSVLISTNVLFGFVVFLYSLLLLKLLGRVGLTGERSSGQKFMSDRSAVRNTVASAVLDR